MRKLLAAAALVLLASSAQATEIGTVIRFTTPTRMAGCTDMDDAIRIKRWWLSKQFWEIDEFVDWISTSKTRSCVSLKGSPDDEWKIVAKIVPKDPSQRFGSAWFCIESTIDFRDVADSNKPAPCFWAWLRDK